MLRATLLLLIVMFSPAVAFAATQCPQNPVKCTQSEAYGDAERQARERAAVVCVLPTYSGMLSFRVNGPVGAIDSGSYTSDFTCRLASNGTSAGPNSSGIVPAFYRNFCGVRSDVLQTNQPNGSLRCVGGCEHRFFLEPPNSNGIVFSRGVSTGSACRPDTYTCPQGFRAGQQPGDYMSSRNCIPLVPDKCPEGQTLVNGVCKRPEQCPDGMVQNASGACEPKKGECPAGQVKGPDGSCVNDTKCPAGQARGKDGSCKKDSDGDGNPDPTENDGKFSGGDTCDEPPQCSGDNILCGQARIQWRIDCNTRRNANVSGGACNAEPICTGEKCDALEYAQLLQQWRAACALERLAARTTSTGSDSAQPDWTKPAGMSQDPGQGSQPGDTNVFRERQVDATSVNTTPIVGGGGTCPGFPAAGGGTGHFAGALADLASPPPQWCDMIAALNKIILLFALVIAIYINVKG